MLAAARSRSRYPTVYIVSCLTSLHTCCSSTGPTCQAIPSRLSTHLPPPPACHIRLLVKSPSHSNVSRSSSIDRGPKSWRDRLTYTTHPGSRPARRSHPPVRYLFSRGHRAGTSLGDNFWKTAFHVLDTINSACLFSLSRPAAVTLVIAKCDKIFSSQAWPSS